MYLPIYDKLHNTTQASIKHHYTTQASLLHKVYVLKVHCRLLMLLVYMHRASSLAPHIDKPIVIHGDATWI